MLKHYFINLTVALSFFSSMLTGCGSATRKKDTPFITQNKNETLYEDAENGISPNWITVQGQYNPQRKTPGYKNQSKAFIKLRTDWIHKDGDRWINRSEYQLPMHNKKQKILSVDLASDGQVMKHYTLGAIVTTKQGVRHLQWNPFYNHKGIPATREVFEDGEIFITFPTPVEFLRGDNYADLSLENNFTVDLEKALQSFEPDNNILSVDTFVATGGNLDNIKLISKK